MRKSCEDFFGARLPIPGLAAVAVRLPDGMLMHECFDRWLLPAQVRQALTRLAQEQDGLARHQIEATRTTWIFEHLRIEVIHRPDKACLALFLPNCADLPFDALEAFLQDFLHLTPCPEATVQ